MTPPNDEDGRGDRPTLVFAHHFGGAGRSWRALADRLSARFDCRTPDLAGFGGRVAPSTLDLEIYATQLEDLSGLPYVLVGHSMGAKIAMTLAARRPSRLRAMILIAPSPPTPEPMEDDERREFVAELGDRAKARTRIARLTGDRLEGDVERAYVEDQVAVDSSAWRWWLEDGSRVDVSTSVNGLALPVLVIAAANDPVFPLASTREVAESFPRSTFEVVADCGHLAPEERPVELAELIATFVDRLDPPPGRPPGLL